MQEWPTFSKRNIDDIVLEMVRTNTGLLKICAFALSCGKVSFVRIILEVDYRLLRSSLQ